MGLTGESPESLAMLSALTTKVQESEGAFKSRDIANCLFALRRFPSEYSEVQDLLTAVGEKLHQNETKSEEEGKKEGTREGKRESVYELGEEKEK